MDGLLLFCWTTSHRSYHDRLLILPYHRPDQVFVQHAPALPLLAIRLHRIFVRCANKARPAEPRKLKSTSSLNGPAVIQSTESIDR